MKKILLTLVLGFAAIGAARAADFDLNALTAAKLSGQSAGQSVSVPSPAKARAGSYVRVSGNVNLNGSAWVNGSGGFTSLTLTGWGTFRDATGRITSNNTYINTYASMWIYPNQHIFQTVRPNVLVQFYRGGKPVGTAYVSGSVSVTGWPTSSYVTLSGSGYLDGSIYVEDAE